MTQDTKELIVVLIVVSLVFGWGTFIVTYITLELIKRGC